MKMKNAEYYINLLADNHFSDDEMLRIFYEVQEWLKTCPPEEEEKFTDSGYGEMLWNRCFDMKGENEY